MRIKKKIFDYLEPKSDDPISEKIFNNFIVFLVLLNTICVILESDSELYNSYKYFFDYIELISVIIFTVELIFRFWTITLNNKYKHPVNGRIKYFFSFLNIIDVFAILPFYLPMILPFDLRFLRIFRIFRFLRVLKLGRYSASLKRLANVFKNKKYDLFASAFVCIFLVIISASLIYIFENEAQPDKYKNIPESMYWSVITLTSVGYGDIYPVTALGKIFTAIFAIVGLGLFALPTGILASGFLEEHKREEYKYCPHCGRKLNE